jgi:carbon monoxide dehydrogenase subunit G
MRSVTVSCQRIVNVAFAIFQDAQTYTRVQYTFDIMVYGDVALVGFAVARRATCGEPEQKVFIEGLLFFIH